MSTILKALRKLEEEKRMASPRDLPGQVLTERVAAPRRARSALLLVTGVATGLLLAILGGAGVFWLKGPAPEVSPHQQVLPAASAVESSGPLAVLPQERLPATPVEAKPTRSPVAPGSDAVKDRPHHGPATTTTATLPAAVPPTVLARPDRHVPEQGGSALPAGEGATVAQASVASTVLPPPGAVWTAPHLQVTEIFPANAAGGRMALVNGLPVMEGTRVDNALVKEVRAGEVLFEIDGRSVAVPLRPVE